MESARFHFDAVIPDGKGTFVRSQDVRASMREASPGDMFFLLDRTGRGMLADCPSLWLIERADEYETDEGEDEGDEDEVERFSEGDDPREILEVLDGLQSALAKHGSTPPVYTKFYWTNSNGERCGSTLVKGRFDGRTCRLLGGWSKASLAFLFVKPRRPSLPITGDRITLEENQNGSPEIEVQRTTLADYFRPHIEEMRSVCQYAIASNGFVRSSFVL
jgi:hypothetical protein